MRTTVTKSFEFEAAHHLPWHAGKCRRPHGHSYRLEVVIEGPLNDHGIVIDFADVSAVVGEIVVERLDHRDLNELFDNPTAEVVAQHIWSTLRDNGLAVTTVRLWETSTSMVEVSG